MATTPYLTTGPRSHRLPLVFDARLIRPLADWLMRPSVAYPLLALLQLRVIWGDWRYRDLSSGDTLFYFSMAHRFAESGLVDLIWSPLYAAYVSANVSRAHGGRDSLASSVSRTGKVSRYEKGVGHAAPLCYARRTC